ncbi:MAG: DUF302 domain-containing protein [Gammaproteobacteria bacterium]|nr:DUF302 domain-containing protein [Gammaproteobacteria bacterium]
MTIIKNGLIFLGILFIMILLWIVCVIEPSYHRFSDFDEAATETYFSLFKNIMATGNAAEASVWKLPVAEGLKAGEVEEVMEFVANEHNIKNVGVLPLSTQIEAMTGKPFRYMKIFMFCNALTAAKMVTFSDAYSAYLPCRVTLIEDKTGKLWLYSLNMDLMIFGGEALPEELKTEALQVKETILDIMKRGASGEF